MRKDEKYLVGENDYKLTSIKNYFFELKLENNSKYYYKTNNMI